MSAEKPAVVGDVIQPGEDIPGNVVGMRDADRDDWELDDQHGWLTAGDGNVMIPGNPGRYGPLTVTAVREPDPICDAATCKKPGHHHDDVPTFHVDEIFPPEQPQQALAQQPVQARDDRGWPLWQHGCCAITAFADRVPKGGIDCAFCPQLDGPWRPLLVGGDPAPEGDPLRSLLLPIWQEFATSLDEPANVELARWAVMLVEHHHEDGYALKDAAIRRDELISERDAARAMLAEAREIRNAAVERVRRMQADHAANEELQEWSNGQLMQALGVDQLPDVIPAIERLKASQPDPLVLTLPKVPEGAVTAIGLTTHDRYALKVDDRYYDRRPTFETDGWWGDLGELLSREPAGVRVEMAPPREPRTWEPLEGPPRGVRKVRDTASGEVFEQSPNGFWGAEQLGWLELRSERELVEVFDDEPGGQQ